MEPPVENKLVSFMEVKAMENNTLEFKKVRLISLSIAFSFLGMVFGTLFYNSYRNYCEKEVNLNAMEKGYVQEVYRDDNGYTTKIWVVKKDKN